VLLQCVDAVCCCSVLLQCVVAVCCCSVLLQCVNAVCCCSVLMLQCGTVEVLSAVPIARLLFLAISGSSQVAVRCSVVLQCIAVWCCSV